MAEANENLLQQRFAPFYLKRAFFADMRIFKSHD